MFVLTAQRYCQGKTRILFIGGSPEQLIAAYHACLLIQTKDENILLKSARNQNANDLGSGRL